MKAWADWVDSSCSRITRPGLFGPVSHCVKEALTASGVVPPVVRDQSNVLKMDRRDELVHHSIGNHSLTRGSR